MQYLPFENSLKFDVTYSNLCWKEEIWELFQHHVGGMLRKTPPPYAHIIQEEGCKEKKEGGQNKALVDRGKIAVEMENYQQKKEVRLIKLLINMV